MPKSNENRLCAAGNESGWIAEAALLRAQLDAESDIQHAQRQEIAALGLVNKELADALEIAWRAGRFVDAEPAVVDRAERALRAAGRMPP